eukprot:TRINITY_DN56227_c0_g1_i1.p1 TRINITY_DN56227_c0_g1~~TRINITY_DN56227_c0_g1_i1.p1  ORF type:complete len:395 (-),score=70.73 TRINITY_DN56227_c0_g1_i1:13-1176(-)
MAAAGGLQAGAAVGGADGAAGEAPPTQPLGPGRGGGAAGDVAAATPPWLAQSYPEILLLGFSMLLHTIVGSFGMLILFHAVQMAVTLHAQDALKFVVSGFWTAIMVLAGNVVLPFSTIAASLALEIQENMNFVVAAVWMPMILGFLLLLTACLAQLTLRKFRLFVVPYALLAALFLVWQAEMGKLLSKVADEEDINLVDAQKTLNIAQMRQYIMFNVSYDGFSKVYSDSDCSATLPTGGKNRLRVNCAKTTMEAQFMQAGTQLCTGSTFGDKRSKFTSVDFERRVEKCMTQGRQLKLFATGTSTRDNVFCRCRATTFDWLHVMSQWVMVVWVGEIVAAFGVLYFGVASNLAKMGKDERREILLFAILGLVSLSFRVLFFPDDLTMDE